MTTGSLAFILSIGVMHEHFNAVAVPIRTVSGGNVYGLSASGLAFGVAARQAHGHRPGTRLTRQGPECRSSIVARVIL